MNFVQQVALYITPVLFGLLAWFIKRYIEKTDASISNLAAKVDKREEDFGREVRESAARIRKEFHDRQDALIQEQSKLSREVAEAKAVALDTKTIVVNNERKHQENWGKIILMGEALKAQGEALKKHDENFKMMVRVFRFFEAKKKDKEGQ